MIEAYESDAFCIGLGKALPLREDCLEADGLLYVDGRLVIPASNSLRQGLLNNVHTRVGHLGHIKTVQELRRDFFWPKMCKDVEAFVLSCDVCQHTKAPTTVPRGQMQTAQVPIQPLMDVAVDFVGPLPNVTNYDMILTCTCRLSGYTRLIPKCQTDTA